MATRLYQRVMEIARKQKISEFDLREQMRDRGLKYLPTYIDTFATPDDIRNLAEILQVPVSILFEATDFVAEEVAAVFEEYWPVYRGRVTIPKQEAFLRITQQTEYRWNSPDSSIRSQVELVLKALESPSGKRYECQYPDCDNCVTRCIVTGHMIGAEG